MKFLFLLPFLVAFLLACSDSDQTPTAEFCGDLDDLRSSADDLVDSVASLDRARIEDSIDDLEDKANAVADSGQEVNAGRSGDLRSQFQQLKDVIEGLGQGGGSLSSSLSQISTIVREMVDSVRALVQDYNCD